MTGRRLLSAGIAAQTTRIWTPVLADMFDLAADGVGLIRTPQIVEPFEGDMKVTTAREGPPQAMYDLTGLAPDAFEELLTKLKSYGLEESRLVSAAQKLVIFIWICRHGSSYRSARVTFSHSLYTISKAFHEALQALLHLHKELVVLPADDYRSSRITTKAKMRPFRDAIGCLDGTFIPIWIGAGGNPSPWRNRHQDLAQTVLVACDFELNFVYVLPGMEGSAHDSKVLAAAANEKGFRVPEGRYYLADAGYTSKDNDMVVTPYQGVLYHLRELRLRDRRPLNRQELFNVRHSVLRSTIERCLGVWKKRFKILSQQREGFDIQTQVDLVLALAALHNYSNVSESPFAVEVEEQAHEEVQEEEAYNRREQRQQQRSGEDRQISFQRRQRVARQLWLDYSSATGIVDEVYEDGEEQEQAEGGSVRVDSVRAAAEYLEEPDEYF